ncbi:Crp/Fnr family transcriptional regulator [Sediminicola luteus]|uniref:Cyclic nucleotide-binding domain-containing protein n=1 Tax=Sediminicola luteus TaxID=319238 RepID=A0A2A4G3C4_9FLAO|nr:cyclic nucleotide-binding domain-containing protein [Sediminicola luteus]PCE62931.1 hypothetical protein B7P33_16785 [Sediminicola luteus]
MDSDLHRTLSQLGRELSVKTLQTLIDVGDTVNRLYLIKEGGLVLNHVHPKTGEERAINFFIPGFHPIATAAEPYYLGTPSIYTLKAFTPTQLVELTKPDFDAFVNSSPWAAQMQDIGVRALLEKNTLRAMLISLSSLEMLQYLQEHYPAILQQVPSKYIADFLGISPQWLSKLKHQL